MNISAIIVTRGDVPLQPVLDSLPPEWEKIVWDNGNGSNPAAVSVAVKDDGVWVPDYTRYSYVKDLGVYGRYAAIEHASHDLIYVQDDDCVVSDPQAIVDEWTRIDDFRHVQGKKLAWETYADYVVCNMPPEFRHDGYRDSALVGFGAAFHRDAPTQAFAKFLWGMPREEIIDSEFYRRTCDIPFTVLTPRVLVDVPKINREFAYHESRMWKQPGHVEERARMLELARQVRDG